MKRIRLKMVVRYPLFKWLKKIGVPFPNNNLPSDVAIINELIRQTGRSSWDRTAVVEFTRSLIVKDPSLARPKTLRYFNAIPIRQPLESAIPDSSRPSVPDSFVLPQRQPNFRNEDYAAFINSDEWRSFRYLALRKYGNACKACGRSPRDGVVMHVDHIIPCSRAWERRFDITNIQILCADCNMGKSYRFADKW